MFLRWLKSWLGIEPPPLWPGEQLYTVGGRRVGVITPDGDIIYDRNIAAVSFAPLCTCQCECLGAGQQSPHADGEADKAGDV